MEFSSLRKVNYSQAAEVICCYRDKDWSIRQREFARNKIMWFDVLFIINTASAKFNSRTFKIFYRTATSIFDKTTHSKIITH